MVTLPSSITLSVSTALTLAAVHIAHYTEQIELCGRGVDLAECRYYLQLWTEIRTVLGSGQELSSEHVSELYDAVSSGDYSQFLTSDELLSVLGIGRAS